MRMHPDRTPRRHTRGCSHQALAPSNQIQRPLGRPTHTANVVSVFKSTKIGRFMQCLQCLRGPTETAEAFMLVVFNSTKIERFMKCQHSSG